MPYCICKSSLLLLDLLLLYTQLFRTKPSKEKAVKTNDKYPETEMMLCTYLFGTIQEHLLLFPEGFCEDDLLELIVLHHVQGVVEVLNLRELV
jgi:hypothetical protein